MCGGVMEGKFCGIKLIDNKTSAPIGAWEVKLEIMKTDRPTVVRPTDRHTDMADTTDIRGEIVERDYYAMDTTGYETISFSHGTFSFFAMKNCKIKTRKGL